METQNEILDSNLVNQEKTVDDQYIISVEKFVLFSIVTFGLYQIWWTYKAWRFYKQKEKEDILPAARAIFSIFFLYSLFERMLKSAEKKGYVKSFSPGFLFVFFIIFTLLSNLPEPYWMISLFSIIFFLSPLKAFNYARRNSTDFVVIEQKSLSPRQIILLVAGICFWSLVLFGLFYVES